MCLNLVVRAKFGTILVFSSQNFGCKVKTCPNFQCLAKPITPLVIINEMIIELIIEGQNLAQY